MNRLSRYHQWSKKAFIFHNITITNSSKKKRHVHSLSFCGLIQKIPQGIEKKIKAADLFQEQEIRWIVLRLLHTPTTDIKQVQRMPNCQYCNAFSLLMRLLIRFEIIMWVNPEAIQKIIICFSLWTFAGRKILNFIKQLHNSVAFELRKSYLGYWLYLTAEK